MRSSSTSRLCSTTCGVPTRGDDHVISCLYKIVVFRAGQDGFSLAVGRVQELVDYVIDSYPKFEVDRDVYGDLLGKYQALKIKLADSS